MLCNSQHRSAFAFEMFCYFFCSAWLSFHFLFLPLCAHLTAPKDSNRRHGDSHSSLPSEAASTTIPGQRLPSLRAEGGRTRAMLPCQRPPSRTTVSSPMEWLTGWACFRTSVSGNNDRSSETSLKLEHRGLTFSKPASVGRLKWSSSNFQLFLSWTRMRQWKFIIMQCSPMYETHFSWGLQDDSTCYTDKGVLVKNAFV